MKLRISLIAALSCLLDAVLSQPGDCFPRGIPDGRLLYGDILTYNLDYHTIGNNIRFSISSSVDSMGAPPANIEPTFSPNGQNNPLEGQLQGCKSYASGLLENDFVFLCGDKSLTFLTYEKTNGTIRSNKTIVLSKDVQCHSVATSTRISKIFVVCLTPESSNLTLIKVDPVLMQEELAISINPINASVALTKNLRILVDDYKYADSIDTLLYIYENPTGNEKVRFRLIRDRPGNFADGGFFSLDNNNIKGLAGNNLAGFYYSGEKVYIATRNDSGSYLQKCYRTPVYNLYTCDTRTASLGVGNGLLKFNLIDPSRITTNMIAVNNVLMDKIVVGKVDPDEMLYVSTGEFSIAGHSLKSITDAMVVNKDIYIVGPTTDNAGMIDGIIKFKSTSLSYEQSRYPEGSPRLMFVRPDFYNTEFTNLYTIGDGNSNFYFIKKNFMFINTGSFGEEPNYANIDFNISCFADGSDGPFNGSSAFLISTTLKINDNLSLVVPPINAFYGAAAVDVPSDSDNIRGNAPSIAFTSTNATGLKVDIQLSNFATLTKVNVDETLEVTRTKYLGADTYMMATKDKIVLMKTTVKKYNVTLTQLAYSIPLAPNMRFIDAQVEEDSLVFVTSVDIPASPQSGLGQGAMNSETYVQVINITTGTDIIAKTTYKFRSSLGVVKLEYGDALVLVVGGQNVSSPVGINFLRFNLVKKDLPDKFSMAQYLPNHVCPVQLSWAPRDAPVLYIASVCQSDSRDNHIYQYDVNFDDPKKSRINTTYVIEQSTTFHICAQAELVNVIDYDNNVVFSLDPATSEYTKYTLPTKFYNIDTIKWHTCNQDDNIVQVLGVKGNGDQVLVTFRGDDLRIPETRVHSIMPIEGKFSKMASSWTDFNDQVVTIVTDGKTEFSALLLFVDGPHISYNIDDVEKSGNYLVNFSVTLQGDDSQAVPFQTTLNLFDQEGGIKVQLANNNKKPPMDGTLVNLDEYLILTGPYHTTDKSSPVTVYDRITQSSQFSNISVLFDDAIFYRDYVFGYINSNGEAGVRLVRESKPNEPILTLDKITFFTLDYVAKGDNIYFFGIQRVDLGPDTLWCIYTETNGANWTIASTMLKLNDYEFAVFKAGPAKNFLLGLVNNYESYIMQIYGIQVVADKIVMSIPYEQNFEDNVADFDLIATTSDNMLVIVSQEYNKQAYFMWLKLNDGSYVTKEAEVRNGITPNFIESHQGISFECEWVDKESTALCISSGKNAYSYLSRYQLNFSAQNPTDFIVSSKVETIFRNIVNLTPVRAHLNGNYVAFVVKNEMKQSAESLKKPISYFNDPYVVLLYYRNALALPVADGEVPIRDAYKVLVVSDLGVKDNSRLPNLKPRLFLNVNDTMKLGVNVGYKNANLTDSVRVFNLDPLGISVRQNQANGDTQLVFFGVNDLPNKVAMKDVFSFDSGTPDKKKSNKTLLIIIAVVLILVLLLIATAVLIKMRNNKEQAGAEDNALVEGENTMKPGEDHTASGNYSKI